MRRMVFYVFKCNISYTWIKTLVTMMIEYFCTKINMETDTFFIKYNSIEINLYIKYNLVAFLIYILNVEKGVVKICEL